MAIYAEYNDPDFAERHAYNRRRAAGGKRYTCPTCLVPNSLTRHEHAQGYQCDACADKAEAGIDGY